MTVLKIWVQEKPTMHGMHTTRYTAVWRWQTLGTNRCCPNTQSNHAVVQGALASRHAGCKPRPNINAAHHHWTLNIQSHKPGKPTTNPFANNAHLHAISMLLMHTTMSELCHLPPRRSNAALLLCIRRSNWASLLLHHCFMPSIRLR